MVLVLLHPIDVSVQKDLFAFQNALSGTYVLRKGVLYFFFFFSLIFLLPTFKTNQLILMLYCFKVILTFLIILLRTKNCILIYYSANGA